MPFQPRMTSIREGISVLDTLKWRSWNGVVADVWHAQCGRGARGEYSSPYPRLFIVLGKQGGDFTTRLGSRSRAYSAREGSVSFLPAGVTTWSECEEISHLHHLDLHFDPAVLSERLMEGLDEERLRQPLMCVDDPRLMALARLIAAECEGPDTRHDLYGDSLTLALIIDVLKLGRGPDVERKRTPLTDRQLRRVTDYMIENCSRNIRLQELAEIADLSQSYFSHAFKAATGLPPHQWQMNARIKHVQKLLLKGDVPLTEIAAETGFSDQAHFTRTFRRLVGETPAAWQKARRN